MQADQEERHTAEVIELKKTQLDVVKQSVEDESKAADGDQNMLLNLVKVKDEEILSPLIPSIKACLEHKHQYVRKNAALTVFHAHKSFGENLIPDAPELIQSFLLSKTDWTCPPCPCAPPSSRRCS